MNDSKKYKNKVATHFLDSSTKLNSDNKGEISLEKT